MPLGESTLAIEVIEILKPRVRPSMSAVNCLKWSRFIRLIGANLLLPGGRGSPARTKNA
jgi:hypothetical protein